ncbi:MAG: type II toxin-antitoxin system HicB family antitoxin [Planctomycetota bacterium]
MRLKIILEQSDDGAFIVYVPALAGCVSQGETREEAIENIRKAVELYLETDVDQPISNNAQFEEIVL